MNEKMKTALMFFACVILNLLIPGMRSISTNVPQTLSEPKPEEVGRILEEFEDYKLSAQSPKPDGSLFYSLHYTGRLDDYRGSKISKNLNLIISFPAKNSVRVKITDAENERWEIPEESPFPFFRKAESLQGSERCCEITVNEEPFSLKIVRKDNKQVIFDTASTKLLFSDLFIDLTTKTPSNNIYGYGERNYKFKLAPGIYTIWGRDEPKVIDNGFGGGNVYGHHPVSLIRDGLGLFYIMLMKNSNAMDVKILADPGIEFKMTGGVIDLVFFLGNEYPDSAIRDYHDYIGNYVMMPFWSMGHHQSRWGYQHYSRLRDVIDNYAKYDIPLDVIWSDIDYMIKKEDFTIDPYNFPPSAMRKMLDETRKHWVPIIDAGVKAYGAQGKGAAEGIRRDIFVKNSKGTNLLGYVWPGECYFVDFFNPDAEKYWGDMLQTLYDQIKVDGIWLDMNEIANFVPGEVGTPGLTKYENLPYTPGNRPLRTKTLSQDAIHYGNILEFDVHELHSILQNKATYEFLRKKSKLPFILTRSSSFGTGQYSAHWTGDNVANWKFLEYSLSGNFNFQIFGSPFVGADICGFAENSFPELCARWIQIGALYPFSRNHNELEARDQEPWTFINNDAHYKVLETYRSSVQLRYSILKWFYSLFIATRGKGSVWQPLMFEFPKEEVLYTEMYNEHQFLIGSHVMVVPSLAPGSVNVDGYFPIATWFDYFTGKRVIDNSDTKRVLKVSVPYGTPAPMYIREGYIMHSQNVDGVMSTADLDTNFELTIALAEDKNGWSAKGQIMGIRSFDDESVHSRCVEKNCLYTINAETDLARYGLTTNFITFNSNGATLDTLEISEIRFVGYPLEFMEEDRVRVAYVVAEAFDGSSKPVGKPYVMKSGSSVAGVFNVVFDTPMHVGDGSMIKIQIVL